MPAPRVLAAGGAALCTSSANAAVVVLAGEKECGRASWDHLVNGPGSAAGHRRRQRPGLSGAVGAVGPTTFGAASLPLIAAALVLLAAVLIWINGRGGESGRRRRDPVWRDYGEAVVSRGHRHDS